jgi:hypothetical protein
MMSELGNGARTRHGTIDFVILGFVKVQKLILTLKEMNLLQLLNLK